ncbi:NAD(P)-dependent oxidoreductase [Hamadaea tsunoensis]|uniref:NAD(P)-dependent oxidoreductase n=1 Tax=Hamadaea tsunoensis TaxID=53368 RepID=UPI00040A1DCA|nr:NAD(P)-binding domain-containing protein [Hamadaea tsunoensis]
MTKIAVLGTGTMGAAMVRRLLSAGHDVTAWNRTAARAAALAADGARIAATAPDGVRDADVVLLMLSDGPAVETVLDEIGPALRTDAVILQMSTIGPDETVALSRRVPAGRYVDAPVAGSIGAVAAGTLTILVGGDPAPAQAVLDTLGTVVRCGDVGAGAATKLVVNTGLVTALAALRDALAVAAALGVPREAALAALGKGPLSGAVGRATPSPGAAFSVGLAAKDLRLAIDRAGDLPVTLAALGLLDAEADQSVDVSTLVTE